MGMTAYDSEAERRLLSNAMECKENLEAVMETVKDDDFAESGNVELYRLMKAMYMDGYEVNLATVYQKHGQIVKGLNFGGRSFISAFQGLTLKGETRVLIEKVKEMAEIRRVSSMLDKAQNAIHAGESSEFVKRMLEDGLISLGETASRELITPHDMAMTIIEAVLERMDQNARAKAVINSSFGKLNKATQGFEKGDLIILSAESGAGKSAFAMNLSKDIAVDQKRPTLYLNSEMGTKQMSLRWGSFIGKVCHSTLRSGTTSDNEFAAISKSADIFNIGKLYTMNIPDLQIENVLSEIRRAKSRYGIEMAIVDYIGRMDTINNKDAKDWQVLLNGARRLKSIAMDLGIVVIMVAQLAEGGGKLAQSSYMKHETDLWLNICRINDEDDLKKTCPWNCYLEFRKARNVSMDFKLMMNFYGDMLTFTDKREVAEEFWKLEYPNIQIGFGGQRIRDKDIPL